MNEKSKNQITTLTKISIVANILLFGVTGIFFLSRSRFIIGFIVILAGLTNICSMLFTFNKKNIFFMSVNVLYTAVSFIVFLFYQLKGSNYLALLWLAITIYYLTTVIILYWRIRQEKKNDQPVGGN